MKQRRKWRRKNKPKMDQLVFDVLHHIANQPATVVASKTWVSPGTISKWRRGYENGGTRYPQAITLQAVAEVAGFELKLVKREDT